MKPVYQIREHGSFITGQRMDGCVTLPSHTFQQLEDFILTNRSRDTDALELMGLSARKGVGRVITAKNYVGIITMNDGTTIEILPKIYSVVDDDVSGTRTKMLLIDMLRTLRDTPFKSLQTSSVDIANLNILEVFIRMFVDEVFFIVKRGLKCSYESIEENAHFFKGKMLFSQQMKYNHSHKERSYVAYDAYTANRPENRLLKACLLCLYKQTTSSRNKNDLKTLLNVFAAVDASTDYKSDFARYVPDRNMKDYNTALLWCRVFLMGKSFAPFAGSEVALALLFPMETLFESYIAALMRKQLDANAYIVSAQDKRYHLFDEPRGQFQLRPDIVITRKADGAIFVLDTKWKLLAEGKANYGISQADMYQMYAYQKKYGAHNVTLIYPKTAAVPADREIWFASDDGVTVNVRFVDLFEPQTNVLRLLDRDIVMS